MRKILEIRITMLLKIIFQIIPFILLIINYLLYSAFGIEEYKMILRVLALLLLFIGSVFVYRVKVTRIQLIWLVLAGFEIFMNGASAFNLLFLLLLSLCIYGKLSEITETLFIIVKYACILMVVLLVTGIIENVPYIVSNRERYLLGFLNPNSASIFYSSFIYLYLLSKEKVSFFNWLFAVMINSLIYYFTNSRTCFYSLLVFLFAILSYRLFKNYAKVLRLGCWILVDFLICFGIVSTFWINKLDFLNKLLSERISIFQDYINEAEVYHYLLGGLPLSIDNFYYIFIFGYGLIAYILFAFVVHRSMKYLYYSKQNILMAFFVSVFVASLMEGYLIRPEIFLSIFIWRVILQNNMCKMNKNI